MYAVLCCDGAAVEVVIQHQVEHYPERYGRVILNRQERHRNRWVGICEMR